MPAGGRTPMSGQVRLQALGAVARVTLSHPGKLDAMSRAMWRRIVLAPGVELHVAAGVRLPHSGRLRELVLWCRRHFGGAAVADEENDA